MLTIRNEREADFAAVEKLTREAFYNMYMPGCMEHYLVHMMRDDADFIKALDFVLELDGKIIGNIMYTKAKLTDEAGVEKEILTFGPLTVAPEYQRQGYGKMLMEHSFEAALTMGYDTVVIMGSPANYVSSGFKSCKKFNVCMKTGEDDAVGIFPAAMLVKELIYGALDGRKWFYSYSLCMDVDLEDALVFDDALEPMEKKETPSQEEFYILSNSCLV